MWHPNVSPPHLNADDFFVPQAMTVISSLVHQRELLRVMGCGNHVGDALRDDRVCIARRIDEHRWAYHGPRRRLPRHGLQLLDRRQAPNLLGASATLLRGNGAAARWSCEPSRADVVQPDIRDVQHLARGQEGHHKNRRRAFDAVAFVRDVQFEATAGPARTRNSRRDRKAPSAPRVRIRPIWRRRGPSARR